MKKGPGNVYDKWNISMVICDTDIPVILVIRFVMSGGSAHQMLRFSAKLYSETAWHTLHISMKQKNNKISKFLKI